jgi:hypothetical protein
MDIKMDITLLTTLAILAYISDPAAAGVLRPEIGAYLETIGNFNPTTEEIYATIVVPLPQLPEGVYQLGELNCSDIMPVRDHWYTFNTVPKRIKYIRGT